MSRDMYNRKVLEFGGAFAADSACISLSFSCFADNGSATGPADGRDYGLLTQQLQLQYQQQVTRLYEVGTKLTYYAVGRTQGSINFARIIGPNAVGTEFYQCIGDACFAAYNDLCVCVEPGCSDQYEGAIPSQSVPSRAFTGISFCLKNIVLTNFGLSVQAQDMVIMENLSLMFTALLMTDVANCPCTEEPEVCCECADGGTVFTQCG